MPAIGDTGELYASARLVPRSGPRKRRLLIVAAGAVLLGALGTALAFALGSSSPPQGYAVEAGSTGKATTLTLPQQIGDSGFDFADPEPLWTSFPALLPTGTPATYRTTTGYYDSAAGQIISVDAVYAAESSDGVHRGVFSVTPQALATLAAQTLLTNGRSYSPSGTGPKSGVAAVECGTHAHHPMCVWADDSVLIVAQYTGDVGTIQSLLSGVLPATTRGISGG